jgi:hypothetical protein
MIFESVLFLPGQELPEVSEPAYFRDLNLDQIVEAVAARESEFDLRPLFQRTLSSSQAVHYRQRAMHDLEDEEVTRAVRTFCASMSAMREQLVQRDKLRFDHQQRRWFLHAVETYCAAVCDLTNDLAKGNIHSDAFLALVDFLGTYVDSEPFRRLQRDSRVVAAKLADVRYCVTVGSNHVSVSECTSQSDYSVEISATFEKFRRGSAGDYRVKFRDPTYMNHVEEAILGFVAKLFPDAFAALEDFDRTYADFANAVVTRFDREVRFYLAYLEHVASFALAGLPFCYPDVTETDKHVHASDTFDLALAARLAARQAPIVRNDFALRDGERIFIVSGPNQGGKTTFARTFGQLHHLALLGVLVPGARARLFVFDRLFTHFERQESIQTLRGKLQDDLLRIHAILAEATDRSVIIINEIFNSTTLSDALFLGRKTFERIVALDAICVCVTFLVDLVAASPTIASLVSEVVPENPDERTFRVLRAPADGRSYAQTIAERYRLTYDLLKERIEP